jgi:2-polyprenyl-3-methyl-5-hydroxy-6-metoxy-1,4-benzoquinol methylase
MNDNLTDAEAAAFREEEDNLSQRQPTRGRQREERRFDKTQLHESHHGQYVHRDYAAHFFRWGWVSRQIQPGEWVLDIGCGQDQPLAKVMSGRPGGNREQYIGVDLNRVAKKFNAAWAKVLDEFNFIEQHDELLQMIPDGFDRIVCLEVIEHMGVGDGRRLLEAAQKVIVQGGTLYLSTPVFSGIAAANHIHEYTVPELQQVLTETGWNVVDRKGTFANISAIKNAMRTAGDSHALQMLQRMSMWFGNDVISTLFAHEYPDASRNNIWVCQPNG